MVGSVMPIPRPTAWQTASAVALVIGGFAVGLIVAAAIAAGPLGRPASGAGARGAAEPAASVLDGYRQTVSNLAVAVQRHDWQSVTRFKQRLDNHISAATINAIYAERSRLLGNLTAAEDRHDQRMALSFRQQIAALCPSVEVKGAPAFCQ